MKTSNVLATALFGAIAAAAPFDRRALVTKTEVVVETVVVYTTIYGDEPSLALSTTAPGYFFEQPASSHAVHTSTPIYTPPAAEKPEPSSSSSVPYTSPPVSSSSATPTPAPEPTSVYTPIVEEPSSTAVYTPAPESSSVYKPAPVPSSTYVAPAPVSSAYVAPVQSSVSTTSTGGSATLHGDITIYDNNGGFGACGTALHDTDMIVALAAPAWGESTYDVQTGAATNPWCGQKITMEYQGNQVEATIMDRCAGCSGDDIDLSLAAWKALTGLEEKTRLQASWWKSS